MTAFDGGTTDYLITLAHGCAYTLSAPLMADNANAAYSLTIVGDGSQTIDGGGASQLLVAQDGLRLGGLTLAHALGGAIRRSAP